MADFCNKCAMDMWGTQIPADLDIPRIFKMLEPNTYETFICEGCGMIGLAKTEKGTCLAAFDEDRQWKEIDLDEYRIPKNERVKLNEIHG